METIVFLTAWYYRYHNAWPKDGSDIQHFIETQKAPISLEGFNHFEFKELDNGGIAVSYTFTLMSREFRDFDFELSPEEALTNSFLPSTNFFKQLINDLMERGN